jgi:hypothetical protein
MKNPENDGLRKSAGPRKGRSFKGQAIMEYLITYGLALFVILIVLAILVAVVLPSLKAPETCQFTQPGFTCNQKPHVLVADSGNNVHILFQLDNTQGKSVVVSEMLCSTAPTGNIRKSDVDSNGVTLSTAVPMASGESKTVGDTVKSDIKVQVDCKNEDGTSAKLSPNSNFKGSLAIVYNFADDVPGAPPRLATATVTGSVQAG